jgi:hypothetical protein
MPEQAPAMPEHLFLVYEIETEVESDRVSKKARAVHTPEPAGAYFAPDGNDACQQAAKQNGRRGVFAAVKVETSSEVEMKATAATPSQLKKKADDAVARQEKEQGK